LLRLPDRLVRLPVLFREALFRAVLLRDELLDELFRALPDEDRFRLPPADFRFRVAAAFRADAERADLGRDAEARPPARPPFREELLLVFLPRPEPLFLPPPESLFTVAQARRSASSSETPRSSYPSSMWWAFRFCLPVYADLSPRGMVSSPV
jgi:hypothetical protein